jgi:hypothetical protein
VSPVDLTAGVSLLDPAENKSRYGDNLFSFIQKTKGELKYAIEYLKTVN